jgi:hypothetical protein
MNSSTALYSLMPRPFCSTENGQSHVNTGLRAAQRAIFAAERPTTVLLLPYSVRYLRKPPCHQEKLIFPDSAEVTSYIEHPIIAFYFLIRQYFISSEGMNNANVFR